MSKTKYEMVIDNGPKCNQGKCMAIFQSQAHSEQAEVLLRAVGVGSQQAGGNSGILAIHVDAKVARLALEPWYEEGRFSPEEVVNRKAGVEDWDELSRTT